MRGLGRLTFGKAVALLALAGAAFALWEWNTARQRQEFIAEIEQRGGKVIVDSGVLWSCGSPTSGPPPPPPTFWDKVENEVTRWRKKGTLNYVEIPAPLTRRDAERMRLLATVRWLKISEGDDEALWALPTFPQLRTLSLHSTKGTDAALSFLKRMPELQSLELRGRGFTDATLMVEHPRLSAIDVSETALSESSFAALATFPRPLCLQANRTGVTGSALLAIRAEKITLSTCDIVGNPFADQALAKLYAAPDLDWLDVSGTRHGPAALSALAANRTLTQLTLNDIQTDWSSLSEALDSKPKLSILSLQGAQLGPKHLKRLLRLPKLEQLHLDRSTVTTQMYENVCVELDEEFDDYRHQYVVLKHLMVYQGADEVK